MTADNLAAFGPRLRQLREAAGLSQEDLAERAGLTAHAVGALERGERHRPYPHTVQLLARALDLDDAGRDALIAAVPRRGMSVSRPPQLVQPTTPPRGPPLVGRRHECAVLLARLSEAWAGRGGVVMVMGEAGIGKTRLARELADLAQQQGAAVLWGSCFEGDWQPPYGPWVEALGGYARVRHPEQLRRELGTGAGPIGRLLPEIQRVLPDVPTPSALSPDEERYRLYDAVVQLLLAASAERLVLVVIDDLHWADADSLRLLCHVARSVQRARLLVIGAYRDPEVGLSDQHVLLGTLASLHRETGYQRLPLRGFSGEEVAAFLTQAAGERLPEALVRAIEHETDGNPFYAGEIFRHLSEEAKVLRREGQWSSDFDIADLGIPEGVRQVVSHRVARLSRQTSDLLRLASGITGGFGFDVLTALSGVSEDMLLDCLDEALEAGLIRSSASVPPRYEFAHAIVRHSLYEALNLDRRARLHRRIAQALECVYAGRESEGAAELAAQYHASAELPGAAAGVQHALAAAEQARSAFAHDRVATFLRIARDLAREGSAAQRADILGRLAIAEAKAVRLEEARRTTEEALQVMDAAGADAPTRAAFVAVVARALKDGGADAAVWEPLIERGLALLGDRRDLLWARLALLKDHVELVQSGSVGCARWLGSDEDAVALARADGDEEDYARTLNPLDCRTHEETGALLALARTWSRPVAIMQALDAAGRDLLYRHGASREACAVFEQLVALSERFGSIPMQGEALAQLSTSHLTVGGLRHAEEMFRRAQAIAPRLGADHRMHQFGPISRAVTLAYFLDGDWPALTAEAVGYATSSAAHRSPIGLVAAALAALSACRAGDVPAARELLQHVTSVAERLPATMYAQSVGTAFASTAIWELRATDYAATWQRLILRLVHAGVGDPPGFGPFDLLLARMATLLGHAGEAHHHFDRARRKLDALGLTHVRAIVDYDEASTLMRWDCADRPRIGALLEEALRAFRAHEMQWWASRAAEQKERLAAAPSSGAARDPQYRPH